jgi:hypothetical protein
VIKKPAQLSKRLDRFRNAVGMLGYLVPKSRRNNRYCRIGVSGRRDGADRYYAVNATALNKYQTIEIRLHSGTVDYGKISRWTELCYLISRSKELTNETANNVDELMSLAGAPDSLTDFYLKRAEKFNGGPEPEVNHGSEHADDEDEDDFPGINGAASGCSCDDCQYLRNSA